LAVKIVNKLLSNNSLIIDNEINELKSIMYREMPGVSTNAICEEAKKN